MQLINKYSLIFVALVLSLCAAIGPSRAAIAPIANNNYTSNEFTGNGEESITVDVQGTTAKTWRVQCKNDKGKWETVQKSDDGFNAAGTFTIDLDNALDKKRKYRVKGSTSGNSGPYEAEATPK